MGCSNCSYDGNGVPQGCGNKGHCSSGSCNKMNTYDWLTTKELYDPTAYDAVEVSFKKGARKDFFINPSYTRAITGDLVVIDSGNGYDVGRISLSGELVRLQMKKKRYKQERLIHKVIRIANDRDLEKLSEVRRKEKEILVRSRVIARTLGLDMKIGDIEFQGDGRKVTIFYTAEGRVDFRELVRQYAKEFRVKIEMRQIGARQESARIGGLGACGRELCCSTWLSDFKSVTTSAARYQNIAINQTKLSGQCGRLKCCLNYELDSYLDALEDFPKKADRIKLIKGSASLIKTDIFKGLLFYSYDDPANRGPMISIHKDRVKEIIKLNKKGINPEERGMVTISESTSDNDLEFADVTGEIELPNHKKKRSRNRKNRNKRNNNRRKEGGQDQPKPKSNSGEKPPLESKNKSGEGSVENVQGEKRSRNNRNRNRNRNRRNKDNKNNNKKD